MPQQNGRLNTDLDNKLTSSYYDGAKWHMFIKALNADIEALGSTTDSASANTVIGLLKALIAKLPSSLQNDAIKAAITTALPAGTNKIGSVDIANNPTVRVDSATPVNVNVTNIEPLTVKVDMNSFVTTVNMPPRDIAMSTKAAAAANTPDIVMLPSDVFGLILEYIIIAKETNSGPVYIGGQTMEPNQGKKLMPGEEFRIQYGGALYFSTENAGDQIDVMAAYIPISMLLPGEPGDGGGGGLE